MSKGSLAQYVVIVLTTLSSSMRRTSVAFCLAIFVIIIGAERICCQIKTVRILARSNRLPLARSSHFPRSVDSIIGTNVARPEPQRSSNRAVAPRDPSLSTHCVGQPVSGSPVKIAALDSNDHADRISRTDKFLGMADCRGRG